MYNVNNKANYRKLNSFQFLKCIKLNLIKIFSLTAPQWCNSTRHILVPIQCQIESEQSFNT